MILDEKALLEKLRRIEALHAGVTTPGERDAAANARPEVCGAPALPPRGLELQLQAFRFFGLTSRPRLDRDRLLRHFYDRRPGYR